jgi:putative DNA primase/helicase
MKISFKSLANFKSLTKLFPALGFRKRAKSKPAALSAAKPLVKEQTSKPAIANPPVPAPPTALAVSKPVPHPSAATPATPAQPQSKGAEVLDSVVNFLRQYLVCSKQQLDVLALWVAHTWCFQTTSKSVYLEIRSPEAQSGKTTCLILLGLLSPECWMGTGPDPRTVAGKLLTGAREMKDDREIRLSWPYTVLLDNHHHTLGKSERQGLLGMLCSGVSALQRYAAGKSEYWLYGPKAFAGHGPLPRSLASLCVPITLTRKKVTENVSRFDVGVRERADALTVKLQQWADEFMPAIGQAAERPPANLPPQLALPELNNCEPLLHIADVVGGTWPQWAREAMMAIYKGVGESLSLTALHDVRTCFFEKDYPPYLLTRDVLDYLTTQENRPWSKWPKSAGGNLGTLLHPFGITSRTIVFPSGKRPKGYLLSDLKEVWERYLPPFPYKSMKDVPALPSVPENKF